jgi:hypothetical protein
MEAGIVSSHNKAPRRVRGAEVPFRSSHSISDVQCVVSAFRQKIMEAGADGEEVDPKELVVVQGGVCYGVNDKSPTGRVKLFGERRDSRVDRCQ